MSWIIDLNGQVALVTGGATGIGAETCRQLALAGASVAINHYPGERDRNAVIGVLEDIHQAGGEAVAYPCDVSEPVGVKAMVADIVRRWGGIDILINNAMVGVIARGEDVTEEMFHQLMNVNVGGSLYCSQACIPHMIKRGAGSIVMISSSSFINGGGGSCIYPATKGAMEGLLKGLVSEYARYNIRINGIRPAVIDTEIMRSRYSEEEWNKYIGKMPMGRAGTVLDVANLIVFLSDKARAGFINGEIVNIDGARIHFLR